MHAFLSTQMNVSYRYTCTCLHSRFCVFIYAFYISTDSFACIRNLGIFTLTYVCKCFRMTHSTPNVSILGAHIHALIWVYTYIFLKGWQVFMHGCAPAFTSLFAYVLLLTCLHILLKRYMHALIKLLTTTYGYSIWFFFFWHCLALIYEPLEPLYVYSLELTSKSVMKLQFGNLIVMNANSTILFYWISSYNIIKLIVPII